MTIEKNININSKVRKNSVSSVSTTTSKSKPVFSGLQYDENDSKRTRGSPRSGKLKRHYSS